MTASTGRHPMTLRPVLYELPAPDAIHVRSDLPYPGAGGHPLRFDLYAPRGDAATPRPVVVFVSGYPDPGFAAHLGCRFKEMAGYIGWARLVADAGLCAVVATNEQPVEDLAALLAHLRRDHAALGIDPERIALWASSGNAPTALAALMGDAPTPVCCAALWYGYLLDLDGASAVREAAAVFGMAHPNAGRAVSDLGRMPLFIARAGRDEMPGLNTSLDRFVVHALAANLPLTLMNHAEAPHAFDLVDDSSTTRHLIAEVLRFFQVHTAR